MPSGTARDGGAGGKRRTLLFWLLNAVSLFLVVIPGYIYAALLDGLSRDTFMLYVVCLIAFQAAVTLLLLWIFRTSPGRATEHRDAR